jgi:hypothetical protein
MVDYIIELSDDGAFDISDPQRPKPLPPKPPPPKAKKAKSPAESEASMDDFAIKKKRGNEAYAASNLDLAEVCYTSALEALAVRAFELLALLSEGLICAHPRPRDPVTLSPQLGPWNVFLRILRSSL